MTKERLVAGALLIVVPLAFTAAFTGLQMTFDYPDILRHPAAEVLTRFAAAGWDLHLFWYGMMIAAAGLIPASIALGLHFWGRDRLVAGLSIGFGVLAGLVQALGLLRWVVLVPGLAANFTAAGATDMDKAIAVGLFDAANRYLGMGVGEHLGYLFTALWTLSVVILLWSKVRWLALAGIVLALGVAAGMLETFGVPGAAAVNGISFSLWALWALVLGVLVLRDRQAVSVGVAQAA